MNSTYTVHNSKICLPKSTNAGKKKKKKQKTWTQSPNGHLVTMIHTMFIFDVHNNNNNELIIWIT